MNDPIVIIGTGLAGYTLARELRKLDTNTPLTLITADDGSSYSKPLLSTGFTKQKTAEQLAMADHGRMAEQLNATIRTFSTVTALHPERHSISLGDETLRYSKLVLAWGADVVRLPLPGNGLDKVFSINDLMDYDRFRQALDGKRRVLIMGSGLIGCEFANDLCNGGFQVQVVAPDDRVLARLLPPPVSAAVQQGLEGIGVEFFLNAAVEQVDEHNDEAVVKLDDGRELEADVVVSAVGLRPRIHLAKQAGIDCGLGIRVNRALETSATDVYALGDCAEVDGEVMLYVMPLMACARALASRLVGNPSAVSYGAMPVVIKTPACPTVVASPPTALQGEWMVEGEGQNLKALYQNDSGEVLGFALTGDCVQEKQALSRQIPPIHREG